MRAGEPIYGTTYTTALFSAYGWCAWCWILMIMGFGAQHLSFGVPFLAYANEAVLPF
jgi:hypothetical protein